MSKKYFTGATYELTAKNMNALIEQLEEALQAIADLKEDIREDRVKPDDYLYLATINKSLEVELAEAHDELNYYKEMEARYNQLLDETSAKELRNLQIENAALRVQLEHYDALAKLKD